MSKRKDKGFIGNPPINKILFVFGKFCTALIAIAVIIQLLNFNLRMIERIFFTDLMSSLFLILSGLFFMLSIFSLKESSSFGLPQKETSLKTSGIYSFSRNPMYIGFYLFYFGAFFYTLNLLVLLFSILGIAIHHHIVLNEEKFLEKEFGNEYQEYKNKVRRYL